MNWKHLYKNKEQDDAIDLLFKECVANDQNVQADFQNINVHI